VKKRLLILSSHPIQYNAPLFKLLATRGDIKIKVFYTWGQSKEKIFDPGFGKVREWDVPLLDGYDHEFIENTSVAPGSDHFKGIVNPGLIEKIEAYDPDAILIFGWSFQSHLKVMRYFKGKKQILFRGDSTLLDESKGLSFKKIIRNIFLTWVYHFVDKVLYVGTANKKYFLKYGLENKQLIFAPHAIDNDRFSQASAINKETVKKYKEEIKIPENTIVFVFAGKLEPKKNPQILIDAFIKLNDVKTHLVLVGNGVLEDQLKMEVACQIESLKSRIHFLPFQNQTSMPVIYCMADVFCLPSRGPGETWGLAVNEAMACGLPILISDKCGCAIDLVANGENGYIFNAENEYDLLDKLKLFSSISNVELSKMGDCSRKKIEKFSFEEICIAVENSFD